MTNIPDELKLTDSQIIDALWKLTTIVQGLKETQDFLIEQALKQGLTLQKKQIGEGYFRKTSSENWKDVYGKLEDLFSRVKGSYKKKDNSYIYSSIKEENALEKSIAESGEFTPSNSATSPQHSATPQHPQHSQQE